LKDLRIEQFTEKDIYGTIELLQNVFHKQEYFRIQRDIAWWEWKYQKNVFGKPIIFLAKTNKGDIVGSRIFWPWNLQFQGRTFKAFQPVDTSILPEFRGAGLFRKMTEMALTEAQKQKTDILFNFPNSQSLPGDLKMGWRYVSKIPWQIKPLKPLATLRSFFNRDQARPVELEQVYELKEKHCRELPDTETPDGLLRTKVSPEFVKWRYLDHPFFRYGFHSFSSGNKWMSGIFSVVQKGCRKEMYLVDLFGHPECLSSFLRELTEIARSLDVAFIAAIQTTGYGMENLWKVGFLKYRRKNMVALAFNTHFEERTKKLNNWKLVGGMHDTL